MAETEMLLSIEQSPLLVLFSNAPPGVDTEYWDWFLGRRQQLLDLNEHYHALKPSDIHGTKHAWKLAEVRRSIEEMRSEWAIRHDKIMDCVITGTRLQVQDDDDDDD